MFIISSVANANITKFSNGTNNYNTSVKHYYKLEINIQYKIPKPINYTKPEQVQSNKNSCARNCKQTLLYDISAETEINEHWIKLFFNKFKTLITLLLTLKI